MIKLFTIGFTEKTAETFFNLLKKAGVKNPYRRDADLFPDPPGTIKTGCRQTQRRRTAATCPGPRPYSPAQTSNA